MFTAAGADPTVVTDVARLGEARGAGSKPRPIKIFTSSLDEKLKLLKNQKAAFGQVDDFKIRGDRPFLRHDQTRLQREADFQLRNQLRQVRQNNPDTQFVISGGKIIPRNLNR